MNIVFITPKYYPHIGGVEKHVWEVTHRLKERGHDVAVITESEKITKSTNASDYHSNQISDKKQQISNYSHKSRYFEHKKLYQIDTYYINKYHSDFYKKFKIWRALFNLRNLLKNADVVHCHDVFIWYLPLRFIYPNKKVYTTFHGYETKVPPTKKAVLIRKMSNYLSSGSINVGKYIKKWYGTSADYEIYGGVSEYVLRRGKIAKQNKKTNNETKMLYFGRLEKDTGFESFETYIKKQKKSKKFSITFIGGGSLEKRAKQLGEVKKISYNEERLGDELQKADIIFSSSYLSIIESLAFNKHIVSIYDNDLKKDYLKLSPFNKWIKIINNNDLLNLNMTKEQNKTSIKKNQQIWLETNTWQKITDKYIELWEMKK